MARWRPDAAHRLTRAALELFEEQGYERTTVQDITERAGLTKSSFFRHFPDKREVLCGGEAMTTALVDGITSAPSDDPWDALSYAFARLGASFMTPERHDFLARRAAVIARTPELREREALKELRLGAATVEALKARNIADPSAHVLTKLAAAAFAIAYERWLAAPSGTPFVAFLRDAADEVRAIASSI